MSWEMEGSNVALPAAHSCKAVAHGLGSAVILRNSEPARLLRPGTAIVAPIDAADFIAPPAVSPTDGAANVPLKLTTVGISVRPRPLVTTGVTARSRRSVSRFTVPVAMRLYFAVWTA